MHAVLLYCVLLCVVSVTISTTTPTHCSLPFHCSLLQSVDEFVGGNIPVDKADDVAKLVAHAMAVDLGDDMPGDTDVSRGEIQGSVVAALQ